MIENKQVAKKKLFQETRRKVKEVKAESEDRLAVAALQRARDYQCKQELVRQLHVSDLYFIATPLPILHNIIQLLSIVPLMMFNVRASPKFIKLDLLVGENNHGIAPECY